MLHVEYSLIYVYAFALLYAFLFYLRFYYIFLYLHIQYRFLSHLSSHSHKYMYPVLFYHPGLIPLEVVKNRPTSISKVTQSFGKSSWYGSVFSWAANCIFTLVPWLIHRYNFKSSENRMCLFEILRNLLKFRRVHQLCNESYIRS